MSVRGSLGNAARALEHFNKLHKDNPGLHKKKRAVAKKVKIDWSKADSMKAKPNPHYFHHDA